MCIKEIASRYNVGRSCVQRKMQKLGIRVRDQHEAAILLNEKHPERRIRQSNWVRGHPEWNKRPRSDEWKGKISQANKGKKRSLAARERMSLGKIGSIPWNKGVHPSDESRTKMSQSQRRRWSNVSKKQRLEQIIPMLQALHRRPTKPEQKLMSQIQESKLPFKYVGDGQFILGGKCPDFMNTNGKKQVIEVFGIYWHDVFDVAERTEHFRQYGFDTLVIWEDELKNTKTVIAKIKKFGRRVGA